MGDTAARKRKNEPVTYVTCPIVFGSTAVHLGKKSDETATHRWKLYIRGPRNEDLSTFVQKVSFSLHPSFPEPVREIRSPPFEVTETGWGEFEASLRVFFKDPKEGPLDLFHLIKLYPAGPPQPAATLKKPAPVVAEQYDEIVFCDPSEKFRRQLMAYTARDSKPPPAAPEQLQEGAGPAQGSTVFDDSLDLERLSAVQQHIAGDIEGAKARLVQLQAQILELSQQRSAEQRKQSVGGEGSGLPSAAAGPSAPAAQSSKAKAAGTAAAAKATAASSAAAKADGPAAKKARPPSTKKAAQQLQQAQATTVGVYSAAPSVLPPSAFDPSQQQQPAQQAMYQPQAQPVPHLQQLPQQAQQQQQWASQPMAAVTASSSVEEPLYFPAGHAAL